MFFNRHLSANLANNIVSLPRTMVKISNSDIKLIRSLSQKKFRDESGLFIVEGEKMINEAIYSEMEVVSMYKRDEIGEDQMKRISSCDSPSPILAVVRMPDIKKSPIRTCGLYLALDSIRDPGNLGTILRVCDWFGIDGIFASEDTVDQYNPKVVQSSMGAVFRKKILYGDLEKVCMDFISAGLPIHGTFLDGDNLYEGDINPNGLIVLGNESRGISQSIRAFCTSRILIPSFATGRHAESLNVAIASAVVVAEFQRKRNYEK